VGETGEKREMKGGEREGGARGGGREKEGVGWKRRCGGKRMEEGGKVALYMKKYELADTLVLFSGTTLIFLVFM